MPRRNAAIKRDVLPDPLYGSADLASFINVVMRSGKKSVAEKIVYRALDAAVARLKKQGRKEDAQGGDEGEGRSGSGTGSGTGKLKPSAAALEILEKALLHVSPTVELKSRRVGGATYQIPIEVASDRGKALARRWLVQAAKGRSEKTMVLRLAAEIIDAYDNKGAAIKMRDDTHRMAKAN
ncbi:MAG TPA: 30S ribosomal protein S7, partial [Gammaproteobacteria bacterium]|nr:30S ribosomal protein S7 [Gammaproteobacteria bacterium]